MPLDLIIILLFVWLFVRKKISKKKFKFIFFAIAIPLAFVRIKVIEHFLKPEVVIGYTEQSLKISPSFYMTRFEEDSKLTMIGSFPLFYFAWGPYYYYSGYYRHKYKPSFIYTRDISHYKKVCNDTSFCIPLYTRYAKAGMKKDYIRGYKAVFSQSKNKRCGSVQSLYSNTMLIFNNDRRKVLEEIGEIIEEVTFTEGCDYSLHTLLDLLRNNKEFEKYTEISIKACREMSEKSCESTIFYSEKMNKKNKAIFFKIKQSICSSIDIAKTRSKRLKIRCKDDYAN